MVEPLALIGLMSNIIDFTQTGLLVLRLTYSLYKSIDGAPKELKELNALATSIQYTVRALDSNLEEGPATGLDTSALSDQAKRSNDVALEVLSLVSDLSLRPNPSLWQAFKCGCRTYYHLSEIKELQENVNDIGRQTRTYLLGLIDKKDSEILESLTLFRRQSSHQLQTIEDRLQEVMDKAGIAVSAAESCRSVAAKLLFFAEESERARAERNALSVLRFQSMRARESDIVQAYEETYEWIFSADRKWNFSEWLRTGDGIFWIAGRAGSGKSTLMKFLYYHQRTKEELRSWSAPRELVFASHFFWGSDGDRMKKSLQGLLQHLLLQILEQLPRLIPIACSCRSRPIDHMASLDPWTVEELERALSRLIRSEETQARFCFFIDGLDEQAHGVGNTINILKDIVSTSSAKLCVSSRPWNTFETHFGRDLSLRLDLHDLTEGDIRHYVEGRLAKCAKSSRVKELDARYKALVNKIVNRAQGVFLWVHLVVDSLLRGLENGDYINELEARLETIPDDLDDYLTQMFDRIECEKRLEGAQILLMLCEPAIGSLPLFTITAFEGSWCDTTKALQADFKIIREGKIIENKAVLAARLDARCSDFVAVSETELPIWEVRCDRKYVVKLLHKSVFDVLKTGKARETLDRWAPRLNPHIALCGRLLLHIKSLPPITRKRPDKVCLQSYLWATRLFFRCQRQAEQSTKTAEIALIEELGRILANLIFYKAPQDSSWVALNLLTYAKKDGLLAFAVAQRLTLYVDAKLAKRSLKTRTDIERPLLDYALHGSRRLSEYWHDGWMTDEELNETHHKDADMVEILLRAGADPNERVGDDPNTTVWSRFLEQLLYMGSIPIANEPRETTFRQAQLMLQYGADLSLKMVDFRSWPVDQEFGVLRIVEDVFLKEEQVIELKDLMARKHPAKEATRSIST